jgi:ferredoxin
MAAPDVFELSDIDGHATAIVGDVPADLEESVREAVRSCPEQAITIDAGDSDSVNSSAAKTPERTTR